jgi:hypothetical protein
VELKKGETIMIDAALHLPASFLHEAFSDRSGVPPDFFELYYRGKRLEGEAALSSEGVGKDSIIEVKMRGRGGMRIYEGETVPMTEGPSMEDLKAVEVTEEATTGPASAKAAFPVVLAAAAAGRPAPAPDHAALAETSADPSSQDGAKVRVACQPIGAP